MTKVIDWINNYIPDPIREDDNELGVEIEVEGRHLPAVISPNWRVDRDGSLRGEESYEYVTVPIKLNQLDTVMNELAQAYDAMGSRVDESIRAGVHVHLNVQQKTPVELFTMVTGYFLLEDLLVRWCGESREGNHFCMRSKDAEFVLYKLEEVASSGKIQYLDTDTIRYCSLNLYSLFKYGTVEFRAMRGTADLEAIKTWTRMLHSISVNSSRYSDPIDMIMSMSGNGEDSVLHNLLPDHAGLVKINGYENLIRDSARRLQLVAHATNWSRFQPKMLERAIPRGRSARINLAIQPGAVAEVPADQLNQILADDLVRFQQEALRLNDAQWRPVGRAIPNAEVRPVAPPPPRDWFAAFDENDPDA